MVAAYLRGLLKPRNNYGLRSVMAENVILEGMTAQMSVEGYELTLALDAATLPVLNTKGIRETLHSLAKRSARCTELRLMDVYRLSNRMAEKPTTNKKQVSLYQLYQIAVKKGMFDALQAHQQTTTQS